MKKITLVLLSSMMFLPLVNAATSSSYTGDYICENEHMVGRFNLDDQTQSHFISIQIERKKNGVINSYSGAASKATLGDRNVTAFGLDNHKLWFNADGTITYNGSIACSKK